MKGMKIASRHGQPYFYDDKSGFIAAAELEPSLSAPEVARPRATVTNVKEHLARHGFRQLLLEVTQKCNLRCRYCCYSSHYQNTRGFQDISMTAETARTAVDFYMTHFRKTCYINPMKNPTISFYGGEPLLNLALIQETAAYFQEKYPSYQPDYNITTNGLLLSETVVDYLVANNFSIIVSLDGNKENHDRNRVKLNNEGSFDEVFQNIQTLKRKYPGYGKLGISMCMDYRTNLTDMAEFVKENDLFVVFISMVSELETDYYQQFTLEETRRFGEELEFLRRQYFDAAKKDGMLFAEKNLLLALFAYTYLEFASHPLVYERRPDCFPYSSSCVPGEKIYVTADEKIHMCERISPHFPIGSLSEGLRYGQIADYINQFNQYYDKCQKCDISRLCNICLARATSENKIALPKNYCQERREMAEQTMIDYVTLMESAPSQIDKVIMSYYDDLRKIAGNIVD